MNAGRVVTSRCAASAPIAMTDPRMRRGRRPNRSDAQPTTGRIARAANAYAPMASPAPAASVPRRVVANGEATGRMRLTA